MTARHRLPVIGTLQRSECATWVSPCRLTGCVHNLRAHLLKPRVQRLLFDDTDTMPSGAREARQLDNMGEPTDDDDPTSWCALAVIEQDGQQTVEEIADRLGLSKMSTHEVLNSALAKFGIEAEDVDAITDWREESDEELRADIRRWLAEQSLTGSSAIGSVGT